MQNHRWLLVVGAFLLLGCAGKAALEENSQVIYDQLGQEVVLTRDPKRVVSGTIFPYVAAWYVATNSTDQLIGMHPNSYNAAKYSMLAKLSPSVLDASTQFYAKGEINLEQLLLMQPDLFFENAGMTKSIEKLRSVGIPVVALQTRSEDPGNPLSTFNSWLELTANITDTHERVELFLQHASVAQKLLEETLMDLPVQQRPKVMMLHGHDGRIMRVSGAKMFGNHWITKAGGVDVAENSFTGIQEVSMEQIYIWNPEVIIISNFTTVQPEDIMNNQVAGQDWSGVTAVMQGRVYKTPLGIYRWSPPNGDAPLMLKWMAQQLHPQLFTYKMADEIRQYYQDFYNYALTDEEISAMLNPVKEATGL